MWIVYHARKIPWVHDTREREQDFEKGVEGVEWEELYAQLPGRAKGCPS